MARPLNSRIKSLTMLTWANIAGNRGCCQEELLANELHSTQAQATQSDLILQFREQRFHLFSFPLCVREAWRVCQVSRALPSRLMHVDGKILQRRGGTLRFLCARPTTFAGPDIDVGAVPSIASALVELLACGTKVAVAFGKICKTLGTVERTVLAECAVPRAHIWCDAPLH